MRFFSLSRNCTSEKGFSSSLLFLEAARRCSHGMPPLKESCVRISEIACPGLGFIQSRLVAQWWWKGGLPEQIPRAFNHFLFFVLFSQPPDQFFEWFSSPSAQRVSRGRAFRGSAVEAPQTSSADFKGPLRSLLKFKHFDSFPTACFSKALKCFIIDTADLFYLFIFF